MLLRGRSHPRAVYWARGVSCGGCNELVRCRTKRTIRTKGNSLEANVEALLLDDLALGLVGKSCTKRLAWRMKRARFSQVARTPPNLEKCNVRLLYSPQEVAT